MPELKATRSFFACLFLLTLLSIVPGYGLRADEIELATRVYPTNSVRAMDILLSAYQRENSALQQIKSVLFEKQYHQFYADLLDRIPANKETADEKLQMALVLGKKEAFPSALSNYLAYYTVQSVADKYPDLLVKDPAYLDLLREHYSPELFRILEISAIRMRRTVTFDNFLRSSLPGGKITPAEVKRYILESWPVKQRDLQFLLDGYKLNDDPDLAVLKVYSSYLSGNFARALANYPALYLSSKQKENEIKAMKIDLPYVFLTALFRQGRYEEALRDIRRNYFPERNDLPEIRYLCYLGLGDAKSASAEIASMGNDSKAYFYTGLGMALENPSNGSEYLEKYVQELDESQKELSASLLIYYAMVRKPEKTSAIAETVKNALLFRKTPPVKELPISYAYLKEGLSNENTAVPSGTVGNFVRYGQALQWLLSDKKENAKKVFFELIRATNTSPVIRSLAVYRARETE